MPGRSRITASAAERIELRALARSAHRGEADRARAVPLTLDGWRADRIAATPGAHVSYLKQHHLANGTFADAEDLDHAIHRAVDRLNRERQPHPSAPFIKAA